MIYLYILLIAIAVGICYRMGGAGRPYPFWIREVGMMLGTGGSLWLLGFHHWTVILSMGAIYGLSTTYFKRKGQDAHWNNWLLVGLAFGISVLPVILVYHNWIGFFIRLLVCSFGMVLWMEVFSYRVHNAFRKIWDKAVVDEFGRGFLQIITLLLLNVLR